MATHTNIYFIRESILAHKPVQGDNQVTLFLSWATDCLTKAETYDEENQTRFLTLFEIVEELLNCPLLNRLSVKELEMDSSLDTLGIQHICFSEKSIIWHDIEKLHPWLPNSLQLPKTFEANFRFPANMATPVREILQRLNEVAGIYLFEPHEINELITAYGEIKDSVDTVSQREWNLIIEASKIKSYDLALFHFYI
jgi:hypothetical protein